ncbi:MAG TPA: 1-phosphofructokinase family hexose kinase [Chitinophagaceae bacterium]|nr:1-phosphofructokinase family hexose kinase [Chitinophagaceae bacterium]
MSSIITITLNPAIDKSVTVPSLVPDKKMRCSQPIFEPGGGGINVARAVHKLGGEARAAYFAGGYTGKFFTQLLEKEGISPLVTEIGGHTRENLVVLDKAANQQYRFVMPGPVLKESEWRSLLTGLEDLPAISYIVFSGSVPEGIEPAFFSGLSAWAKKIKARLIVDSSGIALRQSIAEGVYLIKPNLGELSGLAGKERIELHEIPAIARRFITGKQCEVIIVSMGATGAMLITREDVYQVTAPLVERKSTVGAGDSMVAGIVMSLLNGKSLRSATEYGVAAGTAATLNPGTELCRLSDTENIYRRIHQA